MDDMSASPSFANPTQECDLILKGGITSGVVFPHVICELARTYRFICIGGTSAGAIGAVMTAAAEFRRQTNTDPTERSAGFERIAVMPKALASNLPTFFQPSPGTKPLFDIGMAAIRAKRSKVWAVLLQVLRSFAGAAIFGALPGLLVAALSDSIAGVLLGLILMLVGTVGNVAYGLYRAVAITLPANDFGLCTGLTQPGMGVPAFTNWITDEIEAVAGRRSSGAPLTIGDLADANIQIASVTTDLSSRRPYELPFGTDDHFFRESEFKRLFPEQIMQYLLQVSSKLDVVGPNGERDYRKLPPKPALPVAIIARMSLSFPGLIRAVPLHRFDHSLKSGNTIKPGPVRCLFSDGGITSNFPIHMFDNLLPGRPTFGISLASYDENRHGRQRVYMPNTNSEGIDNLDRTPVLPVDGLLGFLAAILSTARNWQDTLQSQLHGYSERIVEIRLDDTKEGGLNLDMDDEIVGSLSRLGREAGKTIMNNFNFNEHRWRRAVTTLPTLAQSLRKLQERYNQAAQLGSPDSPNSEVCDYRTLLTDYRPGAFSDMPQAKRTALEEFAEAAAAVGATVTGDTAKAVSAQNANLRVTASMETAAAAPKPADVRR